MVRRETPRRVLISVTHVTDAVVQITPDPDPVRLWYGYAHHHPMPHQPPLVRELEIQVQGLRHGEKLEVHLASVAGQQLSQPQAEELRRTIFPTSGDTPHGFGWELPPGTTSVRTGNAWSKFGNVASLRIKYDLVVYRGGSVLGRLDPDVQLEPDP